jgi:hypothetical protein
MEETKTEALAETPAKLAETPAKHAETPAESAEPAEKPAEKPAEPAKSEESCAESYVIYIAKKCRVRRQLHSEARARYSRRFQVITISSILLGFVITSVSQLPFDTLWFRYTLLVLGLASTANAAIIRNLGYETLQHEHDSAAHKYLRLRDTIRLHICSETKDDAETFLPHISDAYEQILSNSPALHFCDTDCQVPNHARTAASELLCDGCED